MNIKKSKFKRFSCVICAVLIGLLTVFSAIGFAPKKEKLSASAATVSDGYCYYRVTIPVGTTAYFTMLEKDCSISYLRSYQVHLLPWNSSISSVTIADNIEFRIGDYFTYDSENNILTCIEMFNMYFTIMQSNSYSIFGDGLDIVLAQTSANSTGCFNLFFSCSTYSPFRFCAGQTLTVVKYDETQTIDYNEKYLLVGKGNVSYDSSEEELQAKYDEGYNAGYAQGEDVGYDSGYTAGETDGYKNGVNISGATHSNMSYATTFAYACEILDDGSMADDYVDILNCNRVDVGTLVGVPLYSLYLNDINKFTVGKTYRVVVQFSPFINYNTSSSYLDELYLSAGKYGFNVSFGEPSERLSNVTAQVYSTTATDYDTSQSVSFISPSIGYVESNLATFKTVSLVDNTVKSCYIKGITFDITFDGYQGIAVFTTQNLLNDYLDFYNYTYAIAEREGNANGYKSGYTDGYNTGHTTGYTQGSTEGLQNAELGSFMNLITAVIDAPIKAFLGLLDFEILGYNMSVFFLSLLTGALFIAVYRLFVGGA